MPKIKNIILSLLLLLLLSVCFSDTISAQEVYTITELELTQLETNLTQQQGIIKMLKTELSLLKLNENEAQEELRVALISLAKIENELKALKEGLIKSETSLKKANQLLSQYEKEMKKKTRIIKNQRNLAYTLLGGTVIYAITK